MTSCLVTGATGYIGGRLLRRLERDGIEAHALVRAGPQAAADPRRHPYDGSIGSMRAALAAAKPRLVFHLATLYLKEHRAEDVDALVAANVTLGLHLLEAMREQGCGSIVSAGTTWQHLGVEGYRAANLYAATKQAFEDLLAWYADACGIRATVLHLGDTYGPDDPRPKLFTLLRDAADAGRALPMSPGGQLLDPLHVDDAVDAFIAAARLPEEPGMRIFGVAPGRPRPLTEIVAIWERATGRRVDARWGARPYREREVMVPWQGRPLPGWSARIALDDGLAALAAAEQARA